MTGATGLVGRRLVADALAAGFDVTAAVRDAARAVGRVPDAARVVAVGDLGPATDWTAALDRVDVVIHCAGRAHVVDTDAAAGEAAFRRVNHLATVALAQAAQGRARRLVFVSSLKVLGEASPAERPWTGDEPPEPHDAYARSKVAAEIALETLHAEGRIDVVVVRPPLVYGPGVEANFLRLWSAVARGVPLPLGAVHNRRSLLYVGNLASALLTCATHPQAAGGRFVVDDGAPVSTSQLVRDIAQALGRRPRLLPVPTAVMRAAGWILDREAAVHRLVGDLAVDASALRTATAWAAPFTRAQGLAETAAWWWTRAPGRRPADNP
ncbi:MAG: NAD-dependent epimerase/dehydratase family protein [Burkholderiales bacterium]|nr:NAD-dependent epimerase/dehydratase family protein [Burkholderiales bacterium]